MYQNLQQQKTLRALILIGFFTACLFMCGFFLAHAQATTGVSPTNVGAGVADTPSASAPQDGGALGWLMSGIAYAVYWISSGIGGFLLGLGGMLLDLSFSLTVLNFGTLVGHSSELGTAIASAWTVLRDLLNIFFIFGLIFIGIRTVWDSENSATRKALGMLIFAALMVNFSLYFTEVIIDFSNIAAVQIYNQIASAGGNTLDLSGSDPLQATDEAQNFLQSHSQNSIAGGFMDVANITTLYGALPKNIDAGKTFIYAILLFFFLVVAAIVFAMGAFLLIARGVMLIIYMVLSPAMFLGYILPALSKQQKRWWDGFIKQAFFAPAFLFMIYISLLILSKMRNTLGLGATQAHLTDAVSGQLMQPGYFTMVFFFCMTIGFLYASIRIGQMMSIAGANTSMRILDNSRKSLQGAIAGGLYRGTVGKGAGAVGKWMDNADRQLANGESEDANYSALRRQVRRFNRAALRETIFSPESRASVGKAKDYKAAGGYNISEIEKRNKERAEKVAGANKKDEFKDSINAGLDALKVPESSRTSDQNKAVREMQRKIRDTSNAQLVDLAGSDKGKDQILEISGELTAGQVKALVESDKVATVFKDKLEAKRAEKILARIKDFGKANKADLNALGPDKLAEPDVAVQLSEKQIDGLDFVDPDKDAIKRSRESALEDVVLHNATRGGMDKTAVLNKKPDFIADLPKKVFTDADFTKELPITALEQIYHKHDKTTQADMRVILEANASNAAGATPRQKALHDFLFNDRIGKNFGK